MNKKKRFFLILTLLPFMMSMASMLESQERSDLDFVRDASKRIGPTVSKVNRAVWDHAETAWTEHKSSATLADVVAKAGFTVEKGTGGIPTAFAARYGTGKPVIAILAEYDCLPNLSQMAGVPEQRPVPGKTAGHGCGHSALGAGSLGAALIVKEYLEKTGQSGTVILFGCPAEEGGQGKTFMVRSGCFKPVDVALLWHPGDRNDVSTDRWVVRYSMIFSFTGSASHAGNAPEKGRSAIDGCELMNIGVNYLREHIISDARLHFAYLDSGGTAPNVIPNYARMIYYVRAPSLKETKEIADRVIDIARGAALMSGTKMEYRVAGATSDLIPNPTLTKLLGDAFTELGGPEFDDEDQALGRRFFETVPEHARQAILNEVAGNDKAIAQRLTQRPLPQNVTVRMNGKIRTSSTDAGDVSHVVPTAQFYGATACAGTSLHSWQMTGQVGCRIGDKGAIAASNVIALAAIRLLNNPALVKKAKEELHAETGGVYHSPLPDELKPGGKK